MLVTDFLATEFYTFESASARLCGAILFLDESVLCYSTTWGWARDSVLKDSCCSILSTERSIAQLLDNLIRKFYKSFSFSLDPLLSDLLCSFFLRASTIIMSNVIGTRVDELCFYRPSLSLDGY